MKLTPAADVNSPLQIFYPNFWGFFYLQSCQIISTVNITNFKYLCGEFFVAFLLTCGFAKKKRVVHVSMSAN